MPGLDELIQALYRLAASLQAQAEAITQLAISNQEMANALLSQPDEDGEEQESGYLS